MPPKNQKNSRAIHLVLMLVVCVGIFFPKLSYAYDFYYPQTIGPTTGEICAIDDDDSDNRRKYGLTKRIVVCIKETVIAAVYDNLVPFSSFFSQTIAVAFTLAIILWGVQMLLGKATAPVKDAMVLGLKMGGIVMFTSNFAEGYFDPEGTRGGLFGMMLDGMEGMLSMIVSYVNITTAFECDALQIDPVLAIWDAVDCTLDSLIGGIFSPITLSGGLIGFLIACIFSSSAGFFIAILGIVLIIMLLLSIARAVYIFITGYLAFALMVLISPIFIPMILFTSTKAYFEKWLKLTIGFILQPIFIFAYLIMLLTAFDTVVYTGPRSLYRAIAGDIIDNPVEFKTIGSWVNNNFGYVQTSMADIGVKMNQRKTGSECVEDINTPDCDPNGNQMVKSEQGPWTVAKELKGAGLEGQNSFYKALGAFKVDVPMLSISGDFLAINSRSSDAEKEAGWDAFAAYLLDPEKDPQHYITGIYLPYITNIIISSFMAVVTGYIFMTMLKFLPFIGSGISGETLSMPTFGVGKLAPPGQGTLNNIKNKISDNFLKKSG